MGIIHGKNGVVKLANGKFNEVQDFSIKESVGTSDATSMGDSAEKHLVNIPGWTCSLKAFYDRSDADGQEAASIGASIVVSLIPEGEATGNRVYTGTCTVMDIDINVSKAGIVERSFTLKGNGPLSKPLAP